MEIPFKNGVIIVVIDSYCFFLRERFGHCAFCVVAGGGDTGQLGTPPRQVQALRA
jgi:hypothetical protein